MKTSWKMSKSKRMGERYRKKERDERGRGIAKKER